MQISKTKKTKKVGGRPMDITLVNNINEKKSFSVLLCPTFTLQYLPERER